LIDVAAGSNHSVGLRQDGTIVMWGRDGHPERTRPRGLTGVRCLSAAGNRTALLTSDQGGQPCHGDLDANGLVDFGDVAVLAVSFGDCPGCLADIDASQHVDLGDMAILLMLFGPCD
jgi:hypothetical protein